MRKTEFVPGKYYHIYNHSVEGIEAFKLESDFKRALVCLVTFNNDRNSPTNLSRFVKNPTNLVKKYSPDTRDPLVEIVAYTFLPTHYHLFIREVTKKGTSRFMHRFSKGYARYFNLKNQRTGSLWKKTFNANLIDNESYFSHIISYVHLNILDLYKPQWRKGRIKDWSKVAPLLASYPWSSYGYYRKGFTPVPFTELILSKPKWFKDYYHKPEDFEETLQSWSSRFIPDSEI